MIDCSHDDDTLNATPMPAKRTRSPEEEAMRIRASSLATFDACERRYWSYKFPEFVLASTGFRLPPDDSVKAYIGTLVHWLAETASTKVDTIAKANAETKDMPKEFWDQNWNNADDVAAIAWRMYQAFLDSPLSAPWQRQNDSASAFEVKGEAKVEHDITLTGTVDCIENTGVIHDIKTTSRPYGISYLYQMAAYYRIAKEAGKTPHPNVTIVKIIRPRNLADKDEIRVIKGSEAANNAQPRIVELFGRIATRAKAIDKWRNNILSIPAAPGCVHCYWCKLKGTKACPETADMY